jgi:hypothetical protein
MTEAQDGLASIEGTEAPQAESNLGEMELSEALEASELQPGEVTIVDGEGKANSDAIVDVEQNEGKSNENQNSQAKDSKVAAKKRQSRDRKSTESFKPKDFINVDKSPHIIKGRGTTLGKMEACKESIESTILSDEVLSLAHRLLYSGRAKISSKNMRANILRYSGFLSAEMDPDKEKQKALDMDEEVIGITVLQFTQSCIQSCVFLTFVRFSDLLLVLLG